MNEESIKKYMDEAEQRLQRLEDEISQGNVPRKKTEENSKEKEIVEFIEFLKKTNATPESEPGTDENNFFKLMEDINKK